MTDFEEEQVVARSIALMRKVGRRHGALVVFTADADLDPEIHVGRIRIIHGHYRQRVLELLRFLATMTTSAALTELLISPAWAVGYLHAVAAIVALVALIGLPRLRPLPTEKRLRRLFRERCRAELNVQLVIENREVQFWWPARRQ